MDEKSMKKLAKEFLFISVFALLQFVLFLSQFNPLLLLLFVPFYPKDYNLIYHCKYWTYVDE